MDNSITVISAVDTQVKLYYAKKQSHLNIHHQNSSEIGSKDSNVESPLKSDNNSNLIIKRTDIK